MFKRFPRPDTDGKYISMGELDDQACSALCVGVSTEVSSDCECLLQRGSQGAKTAHSTLNQDRKNVRAQLQHGIYVYQGIL